MVRVYLRPATRNRRVVPQQGLVVLVHDVRHDGELHGGAAREALWALWHRHDSARDDFESLAAVTDESQRFSSRIDRQRVEYALYWVSVRHRLNDRLNQF